ncbi:MAG: hypothetical protein IIY78_05085 [Clostridia bacterium]|nr:hypothetical protein [Clostridia bacterium]
MTVKNAYCLFEQSGTFKKEFHKLGIPAFDYDICNDFGETSIQVDLFVEINCAYVHLPSIFDEISPEDLILAFFPCTYFSSNNQMFFEGTNFAWRNLSQIERLDKIIERARVRNDYYVTLLKFCKVVEERQLRCIIENPYNAHHYWRFNFPYRPTVIDMNRRLRGDYFKKPTQYIFINCAPAGKMSMQYDKTEKFINDVSTVERSMISPDYARNFICDNILGIDSGFTQPLLFNI